MPIESVYPRLEPLLPRVRKPIPYVGGEVNSVVKDWDTTDVRWALLYPDAYEVGLPNQGVQILYEILNERDGVLAERTYSVWPDLEALMREHGLPQFTVDGHRRSATFDLLGVASPPSWATPTCSPPSTWPGIPLHGRPDPADGRTPGHRGRARGVQPRADRRLHGRRGAGRRRRGRTEDHRRAGLEAAGPPGRPRRLLRTLAAEQPVRPALLRRDLPGRRAHRQAAPNPGACPRSWPSTR